MKITVKTKSMDVAKAAVSAAKQGKTKSVKAWAVLVNGECYVCYLHSRRADAQDSCAWMKKDDCRKPATKYCIRPVTITWEEA